MTKRDTHCEAHPHQDPKPEIDVLGSNEVMEILDARLEKLDQVVSSLSDRLGYVCIQAEPCTECNAEVSCRSELAEVIWRKAESVSRIYRSLLSILERLDI